MFRFIKKRQLNNKGFSLVELLVAIAITAVISALLATFLSSGMRYFRKQNNSIDVQNELQEASNRITDALMEATSIRIKEQSDSLWIYTGDFSDDTLKVKPRLILWVKPKTAGGTGALYIMDYDVSGVTAVDQGYCMSKNVKNMTIELDSSCQNVETGKWEQPLMFNVSLELENMEDNRSDSKTTTLRNKIDLLEIYGVKYDLK